LIFFLYPLIVGLWILLEANQGKAFHDPGRTINMNRFGEYPMFPYMWKGSYRKLPLCHEILKQIIVSCFLDLARGLFKVRAFHYPG